MSVQVKICGINDAVAMQAAVDSGAHYVGLVFYPSSPRAVTIDAAKKLAVLVPASIPVVGLFVDPADEDVVKAAKEVPLRIIQLHGGETPERVAIIRKLTGLPVMKAISIANADDLNNVAAYEAVADMLLFDAKPPKDGALPGGNAVAFDWSLLKGHRFAKPWMLAGGLNAKNLAEAVRMTGAKIIDVSSGVEDRPGHKNPNKIRKLIALAKKIV